MKKTIIGIIILSMMLLGTGYAYWTDTLQVNASISTGKLSMEWVACQQIDENGEWKDGSIDENMQLTTTIDWTQYNGNQDK